MKKFLSNSLIVSFFLLLSKVFGFLRDMLLASIFGSGLSAQAFMVAFRIPEFMRKVASSGAITQIVNPYVKNYVDDNQKEFVASILFVIAIVMMIVVVVLSLSEGFTISIYAAGFNDTGDLSNLSLGLFRIMIPYTLFIFIVAIISAVLNSHGKYLVTSIIPIVLNVVMIVSMLMFDHSIYYLAYSVLIAGVIQFSIALIYLYHLLGRINLSKNIILLKNTQAITFLRKFPSAFIGVAVLQISSLLEIFFASFLASGSLAWLYYADRVNQFLYGIFGTAIATVVIPYLLKHKDNKAEFKIIFKKVFNLAIFVTVPAICGLAMLSKPIVITLFNYGEFNMVDVQNTQLAILGYSVALLCFVLIRVVTSVLYVNNKSNIVFKISLLCLFVNVILGVLVIHFFANNTFGFVILALVTSIIALMNLILQMIVFAEDRESFYEIFVPFKFLLKVFIASTIMLLSIYLMSESNNVWFNFSLYKRFIHLGSIIILAIIVYLFCMLVFKSKNDLLANDNSF